MGKVSKSIKYFMSDRYPTLLTRLMFFYNFRKLLNLSSPKDINEKLQFLKLKVYSDNPVITKCVDKYRVREYLKHKGIPELYTAKLYTNAYSKADDLYKVWDDLPQQFVIKCNHGCGFNMLVENKNKIDVDQCVKEVEGWLNDDQWKMYCEPQYKNVEKCCFVEEYLGKDVPAYKIYCFNGEPKVIYISSAGDTGEQDYYLDYYDTDWNWLDITLDTHEHIGVEIQRPLILDKMLEISRELSSEFPFVRVDLYDVGGEIYLSELTFVPTGGNMKLYPKKTKDEWGNWLKV